MDKIAVYAFTRADDDSHSMKRSPCKGTPEAIERIHGMLIEASMEEVDASTVDENGFYPKKSQ